MVRKAVFIFMFLIFFAVQSLASEEVILLASTEYPPYFGANLKNQGFISEIIRETFKNTGYKVKIKFFPWVRAIMMTKNGQVDGMFTVWPKKEREKWSIFSNPIPPPNTLAFYKKKDKKISYKNYGDLKSYIVGFVMGYAYPEDLMAALSKKQKGYSDEDLITKLVKGTVDMIIVDKIQAEYILKKKYPDKTEAFEFLEPPVEIYNQHLVISKKAKNPQKKINDFNHGLKMIIDDGTLEGIVKRHGFKL